MKYLPFVVAYTFLTSTTRPDAVAASQAVAGNDVAGIQKATAQSLTSGALIRSIEMEFPLLVIRDKKGQVERLTLPYQYVTDENMLLIARTGGLHDLQLFVGVQNIRLSSNGVAALRGLRQLRSATIQCAGTLMPGLLGAISQVTSLESLTLNAAVPPAGEYACLTNLTHLRELAIYGAKNFADADLQRLAALPHLESLTLSQSTVSKRWTNIVETFPSLVRAKSMDSGLLQSWVRVQRE